MFALSDDFFSFITSKKYEKRVVRKIYAIEFLCEKIGHEISKKKTYQCNDDLLVM